MGIDRGKVLHNAQLFASRGQFDAAIAEWKKLTAESPTDGSLHNSIGELHLKRGANPEAVAAFLQAANAFRAEGATLKAIATYKKILKFDPSRYEVYQHLGDLNAERGLLSSAVQDYLTLGKHYLKERKTKDALDIYKRIVSQDPSNLDAQQRVAELCLQENMQDEATKVYLQLGRERSAQQRYEEAKDAYLAVLRIDPANSEAKQFIDNLQKGGGTVASSAKPKAGQVAGSPKNSEPPDMLAEATRRIDEKQFAGAEAILNQLLTREPGNPHVCQLLAKLHLQRGDLHVALGEYRFLAGNALRAQDYPSAESLITEFLAIEPNSVAILELYGELREVQGDAAAAVVHYAKAVELLLEHPEPGMPTLHEELFDKIKALTPDSPIVTRLSALMRGETPSEPLVAEPVAEPVTVPVVEPQTSKDNKEIFSWTGTQPDDAWNTTSSIHVTQDRHFATEVATPSKSEPSIIPAQEYSLTDNAAPDVVRAPHSNGTVRSMQEQFHAYIEAGQQTEAEIWLSCFVNEQPDDAEARALLGSIYEGKGDGPGAALQYARALELLLEQPNLAGMERQAALYAKVKELAPASPLVDRLESRFAVHDEPEEQQEPEEAVTNVEEPAVAGNELEPDVHYTLGVAFKNMGLLEEAKEEFSLSKEGADLFLDSCLMTAVCLKEQGQGEAACLQLEELVHDPRCEGAKAQAIRYELGLLYEMQKQWQKAAAIFESIPTFHDVPKRLESLRGARKPHAAGALRSAT